MADSPTRLLKDAGGTELGWLELRRTDGFYRLITGYKRVYCVLTNDALLYSSKSNVSYNLLIFLTILRESSKATSKLLGLVLKLFLRI